MSELGGLLGKMADAGSTATGAMSHDEFEGLTQEATAIALAGETGMPSAALPEDAR